MPEMNESSLKEAIYEAQQLSAATPTQPPPVVIKPTIGRKVWYFPTAGAPEEDATVIDVHGDRCVSLFVINRYGTTFALRSVTLVQEGDLVPGGSHATWMPYQQGQARKHA